MILSKEEIITLSLALDFYMGIKPVTGFSLDNWMMLNDLNTRLIKARMRAEQEKNNPSPNSLFD